MIRPALEGRLTMNTTLQFSQIVVATLASAALAMGIDWALLCVAFRLMCSAPANWRASRSPAAVRVTAHAHEETPQKRAA